MTDPAVTDLASRRWEAERRKHELRDWWNWAVPRIRGELAEYWYAPEVSRQRAQPEFIDSPPTS